MTVTVPAPAVAEGVTDLAGGLRSLLDAVETEVRAVSRLSEHIDQLVAELNTVREVKASRLLALDALLAEVQDAGLTTYLEKLIRPRKTGVTEVIPERLQRES